VALKKPSELFEQEKPSPKKSVREDFSDIKKDLDKVDNLRVQIDTVSNSINNSLADVLDKNINSLSEEYNLKIKKFNKKIEEYKKNIDVKVNNLNKSNSDLRADVEILEQRQNKINIKNITEEVLTEVQDVLTGNLEENIKRLEDKIEIIKEAYEQNILNEGLLNEPPETDNEDPLTPLDQNFVTQDDFKQHYTTFLNRIQQQLSTLGGGGAVRIQDMDDVDLSTAKVNDKFLKYNSTSGKWEGADASGGGGGSGISTENVRTNTLNVVGVSTFNDDVVFNGNNTNMRWDHSTSDLILFDNTRLEFGSNKDFEIWHGGAHTNLKNNGGDLRIRGDKILLKRADDSERYLEANVNNEVKLFFNGNEKFTTTSTGINVTGDAKVGVSTAQGVILTSPNGTEYRLIVADDGTLSTTAV